MLKILADRLGIKRVQNNLSRAKVGEILDMSPKTIAGYENGYSSPNAETLRKLATLYNCSTDYLLGLDIKTGNTIDISGLDEETQKSLRQIVFQLMASQSTNE